MEAVYFVLLAVAAFWLGACPFSLWLGKWLLNRDIRDYGDSNPGATNVFRAGSKKVGVLALILDMGKGMPFVVLANSLFKLPSVAVMAIGLSAILGHAYSPLLHLKGGKALAVTGGVLLALPQHEIFISLVIFTLLGFLLIEIDAWTVMFGVTGSFIYLAVTKGISWEPLFMLCILAILVVKHFDDLKTTPRFQARPVGWLRARKART
jgi:glycerol-3-phosphate acyltransferase PlsY